MHAQKTEINLKTASCGTGAPTLNFGHHMVLMHDSTGMSKYSFSVIR